MCLSGAEGDRDPPGPVGAPSRAAPTAGSRRPETVAGVGMDLAGTAGRRGAGRPAASSLAQRLLSDEWAGRGELGVDLLDHVAARLDRARACPSRRTGPPARRRGPSPRPACPARRRSAWRGTGRVSSKLNSLVAWVASICFSRASIPSILVSRARFWAAISPSALRAASTFCCRTLRVSSFSLRISLPRRYWSSRRARSALISSAVYDAPLAGQLEAARLQALAQRQHLLGLAVEVRPGRRRSRPRGA